MYESTEMSKFPEMMRIVAPVATRPSTVICWNRLDRFAPDQKRELSAPVATAMTTVTTSSTTHWFSVRMRRTDQRERPSVHAATGGGTRVDSGCTDTDELLHE